MDSTGDININEIHKLEKGLAYNLSESVNFHEVLDSIITVTGKFAGIDCGGIYLFDKQNGSLKLKTHRGLPDNFIKKVSEYSPGSEQIETVKKGQSVFLKINELQNNNDINYDFISSEGLKFVLILPVIYKNDIIGCLNLASHTASDVNDIQKTILESIAAQISGTIIRIITVERLNEDESNLKKFFESIDDLIFVVDKNNRVIHISDSVMKLLNYSKEEILYMDIDKLFPSRMKEKVLIYFNIQDKIMFDDLPILSKNGDYNFIEAKLNKGFWHNKEVTFAFVRDINERKKAEEQIKNSQVLYSTTVNSIKEFIYVVNKKLDIVLINKSLSENTIKVI